MDYISLAIKLRDECGVTGTDTTVTGASGEWNRLVMWIRDAWDDIQEMHETEWLWMRQPFSFDTTINKGEYSPAEAGITDFAAWKLNTVRCYLKAQGITDEQWLSVMDYDAFRDLYLFNQTRVVYTRPVQVAETPSLGIILGPAPDAVYTVVGDYQRTVQTLADDADTPNMPARFHRLIVYRAMMDYGVYEAAQEVYERGQNKYKTMMSKLRLDQLPGIQRGRCLI